MNILIISFITSHNLGDNAGNNNYIRNITTYFKNLGHKIYFLYVSYNIEKPDFKTMEAMWDHVEVVHDTFTWEMTEENQPFDFAYKDFIAEAANRLIEQFNIDICICHYFMYSKVLEMIPDHVVKVIDTHDVFTNRFKYLQRNLVPREFFNLCRDHEKRYLDRADIILARTESDKVFFNDLTNSNKAIVITNFELNAVPIQKDYQQLTKIGFVGSFNKINIISLLTFLNQFEKSYKKGNLRNVKIEIVGNVLHDLKRIFSMFKLHNKLKLFFHYPRWRTFKNLFKPNLAKKLVTKIIKRNYFVNLGYVKDLNLFYRDVDLIVLPIVIGTGINIKTVEALSQGVPAISTTNGFKGFHSDLPEHNCTNIRQIIQHLELISQQPSRLNFLANASKQVYQEYTQSMVSTINQFFECCERFYAFPKFNHPKVSIIIPTYNKLALTLDCLHAILANTTGIEYEVIVVDDASTDATQNLPRCVRNVTVIRNQTNKGYLQSCNIGSEVAKGEYIVLLNNDTLVHKGWLKYLLHTFEIRKDAGIVGGKLLTPDGSIQEAGAYVSQNNIHDTMSPHNTPKYGCEYLKPVDYVSGACVCIKKELFDKVGKLDPIYGFGYSEDPDLSMKFRQLGYQTYYQPKAKITHLLSKTMSSSKNELMQKNKQIFGNKWRAELQKHHTLISTANPPHSELFLIRNRAQGKKTILCFDDCVPSYLHGGGRCSLAYLQVFIDLGLNVKFFPQNIHVEDKEFIDNLQQMGIEVVYPIEEIPTFFQDNGQYVDYVLLQRPYSHQYLDLIKQFTKAKIFYYGHDLHFMRASAEEKAAIQAAEFKLIAAADATYYPTKTEVDTIKDLLPYAVVHPLAPFLYHPNQMTVTNNFSSRNKQLLFVSSTHSPNLYGLQWFIREVWDQFIYPAHPDISLTIIGSIKEAFSPTELQQLALKNIYFVGRVSEPELHQYYQQVKAAIHPGIYGTGIITKVVEAIYHGVPMITTTNGSVGLMEGYDNLVYVANEPHAFAEQILNVVNDQYVYDSSKAQQYISQNYCYDNFKQQVQNMLSL